MKERAATETRGVTDAPDWAVTLWHREGGHKTVNGASEEEARKACRRICERFKGAYRVASVPYQPKLRRGIPMIPEVSLGAETED